MTLSCRDLWFRTPDTCTCGPDLSEDDWDDCPHDTIGGWTVLMYGGRIRPQGRILVSDRSIALYVDQLTGCHEMPRPRAMTAKQLRYVAGPLLASPLPGRPNRLFNASSLDLIETAGYRVARIHGHQAPHAIVNDSGRTVGLIAPIDATVDVDTLRYPVREVAA